MSDQQPPDQPTIVLPGGQESGDGVVLPEGSQLLIEGWPSARFQLLVTPQACGNTWRKRLSAFASRRAPRHAPSSLPQAA